MKKFNDGQVKKYYYLHVIIMSDNYAQIMCMVYKDKMFTKFINLTTPTVSL